MVDTADICDYIGAMNDDYTMTLRMPREMAAKVDDYWHTMRLNSRNEAIRALLDFALEQYNTKLPQPAKEPRR